MADEQTDAEEAQEGQTSEAQDKAREAEETHNKAQETVEELEQKDSDDLPKDLEDWPDDEAKYVTFGGAEGDHGYDEGPEKKLGPSSLERRADGSVLVEGEEVDNPDDYKGEPIKGGPTDPDAPELPGERKKREKLERTQGEGAGEAAGKRGEGESDGGGKGGGERKGDGEGDSDDEDDEG
jgi:hypothetical protein